jgi:aminoacrylate hydrolase
MVRFDLIDNVTPGARTVVLSSGLGGAAAYWAPQLPALCSEFRVITYDHAGTGRSSGALPDDYAIADMAADVQAILAATGTPACHFVGHALGGLIGLELARLAPAALASLTIVNGWAKADPHTLRCFQARLALLQHAGIAAYVRAQPIFLYPATWLAANEARMAAEDAHGVASFQGEDTLLKRVGALRRFDATQTLGSIHLPTLLIASRDDVLVPATQSERLAAGLPQASLSMVERGGHALNVTDPATFDAILLPFLRHHG